MLTQEIARDIVEQTTIRLNRNINIMDKTGTIIASTNPKCNLNIGDCAKKMFIHRNSLIYRLKKVKEITGYNPQELSDVIPLQLAIWLREMDLDE
ncbi:hypothetical protein AJ85_15805 [Alkalihalobacillus alcalophilus ATCC 27647 = CGMCC 1.3604]|uniref:PucR C-terminal helix-turn-helix domain-containing protein n=1 Tax=Alkalihalobacillus alcalophilus ATCC 27647 = CGMCC 1.3604 TaxID=1218173 RepID=A0A094YZM2_ALKAL|nr:helix-turn-helix domain-containing protein [Alkalihalobacillus alcalophilus]KGA99017.1 hypothetical protein BALCAV_0200865 [Alkalihalobacillus alcalophilus ATCC 27647 = CGMCC 1.3604]MED1560657.1 helix-turn-helix domain-containing protein [Alkalihalobacillus alcalophilus]THG89675.1 hypothetical protein AJ85_15805 [Alkalihalobacillus alcalophilus ATCC 27647 = CGMCC 1.3604]